MAIFNQSVCCVIRGCGERTTDLCYQLMCRTGWSSAVIEIVEEAPFAKALETSYQIGIDSGKEWLLCVDADVLMREKSVRELLDFASISDPLIFEIQGYVLDKFFGGARSAGNHLYRTRYLEKALKYCADAGESIRPENTVIKKMADEGYGWLQMSYVVGLHDYEQSFEDIYRKTFVYAHKHLSESDIFLPRWSRLAPFDGDFEVALHGFSDGLRKSGSVCIDVESNDFVPGQRLAKKLPLVDSDWSPDQLENMLDSVELESNYVLKYPGRVKMHGKHYLSERDSRVLQFIEKTRLWFAKILIRTGLAISRRSFL
jgi:hypothetical protein